MNIPFQQPDVAEIKQFFRMFGFRLSAPSLVEAPDRLYRVGEKKILVIPRESPGGRFQEELPMNDWTSLLHVHWDCKYHIVFVPKYRQKKLYGKFRIQVGEIMRELYRQKGAELR